LAKQGGISVAEARRRLGIHALGPQNFVPGYKVVDRGRWHAKVEEIVASRVKQLGNEECAGQWEYLLSRGLSEESIARARLGGCFENRFYKREDFGLAPETDPDTGKPRMICVPVGILIPYFNADGQCVKVQSRCDDDHFGRYRVFPGSQKACMVLRPQRALRAVVAVEAALDALLCNQEVPDDFAFIALGSTSYRPDAATDALFREAGHLLIATDSDDAGAEAHRRFVELYPSASRLIVPPEYGKDVGEAYLRGMDVRDWCELGLELAKEVGGTATTTHSTPKQSRTKRPEAPSVKSACAPKEGTVEIGAHSINLDVPYVLVTSAKAVRKALKELRSAKLVAIDIETAPLPEYVDDPCAALDPWRARPRLLQAVGDGQVYLFDLDHVPLADLEGLFAGPWAAHNAIFDLKHLLQAELAPVTPYCTLLMDNSIYNRQLSLAEACAEHLDIHLDKTQQTSDWGSEVLTVEQLKYAARDVLAVRILWECLKRKVRTRRRGRLCQLMHDAQLPVALLELNGIGFNAQAHGKLLRVWARERREALGALKKLAGPDLNFNSTPQVAKFFEAHAPQVRLKSWPRTKSGQLSTRGDDLKSYADLPAVAAYRQYCLWNDRLKSFGESLVAQVSTVTERLHPHFRIAGALTGRMSASAPNVQGLPHDREFRALFVPQPGYQFVRADYNQMQLRIAALLSGDPKLLAAYEKGLDVHRLTAARVLGKKPAEITTQERNLAKAIGFGILFGMGAEGLRRYAMCDYGVPITLGEAKRIRDRFFETYVEVRRWQLAQVAEAENTACSTTPMGRVRNFTREDKDNFCTAALNTPIQGAEGEVMLAALALLPKALEPFDALLVNCVHDEVLIECPEEHVDGVMSALKDCMERGMRRVFPKATLKGLVEVGHGPSWGAAK
jgi:DNA polymerase-1